MRVFIAINPPAELRASLAQLQRELQSALPKNPVRWTAPEQIHLTLRFLGDIADETVNDLENALRRGCEGVAAFELRAQGAGCFPNARQPRIVWAGLEDDRERLPELHRRITRATAAWGQQEERAFHPHLTLGRVKDPRSPGAAALGKILTDFPRPPLGTWRVERLELMKSELGPDGARHTRLAEIGLGPT